ncbi:MAG: hypothetical protein GY861_26910 [bacterium]|nr:hypothetical protein [bacterium]
MIITICNYNEYQSMRTYQNDTENASKTIQERHRNDTGTILIKKNDKNIKNDKNVKKKNPPKNKYGEYGKVRLTEREYKKLNADWGQDKLDEMIRVLDEGIELKGYKYKNHNLAIRKWANNQTEIKSKPQEVLANVYNRFLEEEKNGKNRDNPSSDLFG